MIDLSVIDVGWPPDGLRLACHAEALGYKRYWTTEHRTTRQSASPVVMAAMAAALTTRIRIGTAGVSIRYESPLKVAEAFSLLELLSPGRIDLGVISKREPDAIHRALLVGAGDGDDFESRVHALASILAGRQSTSGDGPPSILSAGRVPALWVCGTGTSSARLAGAIGARFAHHLYLARQIGVADSTPVVDSYRRSCEASGSDPVIALACYGVCAATDKDAETMWRHLAARPRGVAHPGAVWGTEADRTALTFFGGPATCAEQIHAAADHHGVKEIVVQCLAAETPDRLAAYELLANVFTLQSAENGSPFTSLND